MNINTGQLVSPATFDAMPEEKKKQFVQVNRDLTKQEERQMEIKKYSPCGCGSGKKFKFCCYKP